MANKKKKICFIIPTVSAGGLETYLLRFLEYYCDVFEVTVIARKSGSGELYDAFKNTNAILKFKSLGFVNPIKALSYYRYFKSEKFDTVCDFNANFSGTAMYMARLAGIENRITFYRQGSDHFKPGFLKNSVNYLLNRLVYLHSTKILFNSHAALEVFFPKRKKSDSRFDVIYNGISAEKVIFEGTNKSARQQLGLPEDKFIIGHVGRYDTSKNHETIIKTASLLSENSVDFHFLICGSGTEALKMRRDQLGLKDKITILGYRSDIPIVLHSLDLFFFPSITEGQPNALIEAMLAGLPLMASNIAPIKECLPVYYQKYLANPHDFEKFAEIAQSFKENKSVSTLEQWAKERFNSNKNLKKFKEKLIP